MEIINKNYFNSYKAEQGYILRWAKKIKAINLLGGNCNICNKNKIEILTFHHIDPNTKEDTINNLREGRWSNIKKEVKKCICVCENCHRILHHKKDSNKLNDRHIRNKLYALQYKNEYKCKKCNFDENNKCLEFHHSNKDEKSFSINSGLISKRLLSINDLDQLLKNELDKCEILCSNCHRTEHFDKEQFEFYKTYIYDKMKSFKEIQSALDKNLVMKMYESGVRQIDIAKHFKASKGTISGIIKKFKINNNLDNS